MASKRQRDDKDSETLAALIRVISENGGKPYHAAQFLDVNPNLVKYVMEGGKSAKVHNAIYHKTGYVTSPQRPIVKVSACPACGRAHTVPWCVTELGEPKRPRRPSVRQPGPPSRISIQRADPVRAAKAIKKHMESADIARLISELQGKTE